MESFYDGIPPRHNYGINMGDTLEAITLDDERYDPAICKNFPLEQMKDAIELLRPIKKKLLCMLYGNHEKKLMRFGNLTEWMAQKLDVPYGTFSAKLTYVDRKGRLLFKHFVTHGRKSINSIADDPIRRIANLKLILKKHLKYKAGDAILMCKGHTHKLLVSKPESELYLTDDTRKLSQAYTTSDHTQNFIHPDHRWYVNTGSFYRLYELGVSGYAEEADYDPIAQGFAVVRVRDRIIVGIDQVEV